MVGQEEVGALPRRPLGDSGLEVSVVGLGCNNFGGRVDAAGTRAVVDAALDEGIDFLDTADVYGRRGGSESLLGEVLEGRRDRVVLATKFGMDMQDGRGPRGSREYVREAAEASLRRLRTDRIDLLQYHEPDGVTPIDETLGALGELVDEGKVRCAGCSNFSAEQIEEAERVAREQGLPHFVSVQNEYSLLNREVERDVVPACLRLGLGLIPYFPLASGLLTGKYRRGQPAPEGSRLAGRGQAGSDEELRTVEELDEFARARGVSLLEVAIGGLAAKPAVVSVIAGATRPEQVRTNAAAGRWSPGEEDLRALDAIGA